MRKIVVKILIMVLVLTSISGLILIKDGFVVKADPEDFYGAVNCYDTPNLCSPGQEECGNRHSTGEWTCFRPCGNNVECISERYWEFNPDEPAGNWSFVGGSQVDIELFDGQYSISVSESLFDSSYNTFCPAPNLRVESSRNSYDVKICYTGSVANENECGLLEEGLLCSIDNIVVTENADDLFISYRVNAVSAGASGTCVPSGVYTQEISSLASTSTIELPVNLTSGSQDAQFSVSKEAISSFGQQLNFNLIKDGKIFCRASILSEIIESNSVSETNYLQDGSLLSNFGARCLFVENSERNAENEARYNCGAISEDDDQSYYKCFVADPELSLETIIVAEGNKITSNTRSLGLYPPSQLVTNPDLNCGRCYTESEPVAVDGDQLVLCGADGLPLRVALINNNIADSISYYSQPENNPNRDYVKECRAQGGIPTAIGCIDTTPIGIITGLIRIALGVMGGVALIQLIIVGLRYQQGKEDEIKKAREQLVATITGLAVLVFSVLILRILGVNILDIIPAGTI